MFLLSNAIIKGASVLSIKKNSRQEFNRRVFSRIKEWYISKGVCVWFFTHFLSVIIHALFKHKKVYSKIKGISLSHIWRDFNLHTTHVELKYIQTKKSSRYIFAFVLCKSQYFIIKSKVNSTCKSHSISTIPWVILAILLYYSSTFYLGTTFFFFIFFCIYLSVCVCVFA